MRVDSEQAVVNDEPDVQSMKPHPTNPKCVTMSMEVKHTESDDGYEVYFADTMLTMKGDYITYEY